MIGWADLLAIHVDVHLSPHVLVVYIVIDNASRLVSMPVLALAAAGGRLLVGPVPLLFVFAVALVAGAFVLVLPGLHAWVLLRVNSSG